MSDRFEALPATERVVAGLSARVPTNPFATVKYFEARRRAGWSAWLIARLEPGGGLDFGCGAFLTRRARFLKIEIPSLPPVPVDSRFWDCLKEFCRAQDATKVELNTFGSPPGVEIPDLGKCTHRDRCEWILDLEEGDLRARMDNRHRANIKKAEQARLAVLRTHSVDAVCAHQAMIGRSLDRRRARGEEVPVVDSSVEPVALLQTGAAEIYQAIAGEVVLSSALVLRSPKGAYGHSTGTSPDGMNIGASHYLINTIAERLRAEGVPALDFGAAEEGSGLARFKRGFGTSPVHLPSAVCYVGPRWRRKAYRALESVRSEQRALASSLQRRISRSKVPSALEIPVCATGSRHTREVV